MLVPSMTFAEIRKEIEKDFPILYRKMGYVTKELAKEHHKEIKKNDYVAYFDYCSKYKNHWIYWISITKYKGLYGAMLLYHNGKKRSAIAVTYELNIIYHTGHFFDRFNERLKLGFHSFTEIVQYYLAMNNVYRFQELDEIEPDNVYTMFCIIPSGVILGMYNRNLNLIKANTFITNEMMHKDQRDLREYLRNLFDNYKSNSAVLD
jgi:hypothetical protein